MWIWLKDIYYARTYFVSLCLDLNIKTYLAGLKKILLKCIVIARMSKHFSLFVACFSEKLHFCPCVGPWGEKGSSEKKKCLPGINRAVSQKLGIRIMRTDAVIYVQDWRKANRLVFHIRKNISNNGGSLAFCCADHSFLTH